MKNKKEIFFKLLTLILILLFASVVIVDLFKNGAKI